MRWSLRQTRNRRRSSAPISSQRENKARASGLKADKFVEKRFRFPQLVEEQGLDEPAQENG